MSLSVAVTVLDWRLFRRLLEMRRRQYLMTAVLAGLVLSRALQLGRVVDDPTALRGQALATVFLLSWAVCGGCVAIGWLTGHAGRLRLIRAQLAAGPHRPRDLFVATKAAALLGSNVVAVVVLAAPFYLHGFAQAGAGRLALCSIALLLVQSTAPSLLTVGHEIVRGLDVKAFVLALALVGVAFSIAGPAVLQWVLEQGPPALLVHLLTDAAPLPAFVALLLWVLGLWMLELVALRREGTAEDRNAPRGRSRLALSSLIGRLGRLNPVLRALVWRQLLALARLRRFQLAELTATALCLLWIWKVGALTAPALVLLSLVVPAFCSFPLANALGVDSAGLQLLWLLPNEPAGRLLTANEIAVAVLTLPGSLAVIVAACWRDPRLIAHLPVSLLGVAIFWLAIAALGRFTSVVFPLSLRHRQLAGEALPAGSSSTLLIGTAVMAGAVLYVAARPDAGLRWGGLALLAVLTLLLHRLFVRIAGRLLTLRRDELVGFTAVPSP